jgi:hypothetical protein
MSPSLHEQFITSLEALDAYKHDETLINFVKALKIDLQNIQRGLAQPLTDNELASMMMTMIALYPNIMNDKNNLYLKQIYGSVHPTHITLQPVIHKKLFPSIDDLSDDIETQPSFSSKK